MSVFDHEPAPPPRRWPILLVVLMGAAVAAATSWFLLSQRKSAPRGDMPAREAPARPRPSATREPAPSRETAPAATDRPAPVRESAEPGPPAAPSRTAGVLRVRSDVPGASVFLDRKFLGTTPLEVDGLAAGSHRLNVSVEGYEGHAQAIEIGETPADVDVRFKDVRLNASVAVVHKHGMGSCSGQLVADPAGLRYETPHREDAFTLRFEDVDIFVVDYLKKNLRVKKRGGRTWNFEDARGQADPLFVFHRDVEKARARLTAK
jgi:hypothetical protein